MSYVSNHVDMPLFFYLKNYFAIDFEKQGIFRYANGFFSKQYFRGNSRSEHTFIGALVDISLQAANGCLASVHFDKYMLKLSRTYRLYTM